MIKITDLTCHNCIASRHVKGQLKCLKVHAFKCEEIDYQGCYEGSWAVKFIGDKDKYEYDRDRTYITSTRIICWYEYWDELVGLGLDHEFVLRDKLTGEAYLPIKNNTTKVVGIETNLDNSVTVEVMNPDGTISKIKSLRLPIVPL